MKNIVLLLAVFAFTIPSCKKDNIEYSKIESAKTAVGGSKQFGQIEPIPLHPQLSWYLILRLDGTADIAPGMDTMEKSIFSIKENSLTVKTNRGTIYEFEILSETDIKLKNVEAITLRLRNLN